ncbi:MAG TPA: hypothetical protein PK514_08690 [Spirochaetota bacterium]|nr:hypothetical protein [Spirochaetota bacterium]
MKKFLLPYSIIISILLNGCASKGSIIVKNDIKLRCNPVLTVRPGEDENAYSGLTRYETQRFFCTEGSTRIHTAILEAGSTEAINGNLFEAETIFMELKETEKNGAVENNLAIIYELKGKNSAAFTMYSSALLLSPDNMLFKKNLYCFISDSGLQSDAKIKKKWKQINAQR